MEVKNCKNCGRLYNYIGGVYRLCPECMRKLEEKFQEVKDYIEEITSLYLEEEKNNLKEKNPLEQSQEDF